MSFPLLISIPAAELACAQVDSTVFSAAKLLGAPISAPLHLALSLLMQTSAPLHSKVLCVARPEMFTHGESLAWLQARIEGATEHVCLSDGQTVKSIPGLKNTLFIYGLEVQRTREQFRTLLRRAPEQLDIFAEQINTSHAAGFQGTHRIPDFRVMEPQTALPVRGINWYSPLYLNRHSFEDSAERALSWGGHGLPKLDDCTRGVIVGCTDAALHDAHFCSILGQWVSEAARDPQLCLIIRLPQIEDRAAGNTDRIKRLLAGIQRGEIPVPRVKLEHVLLTSFLDELDLPELGMPYEFLFHDSYPFWGHTHAFYSAAQSVSVCLSRVPLGRAQEGLMIQEALIGRAAEFVPWTRELLVREGFE